MSGKYERNVRPGFAQLQRGNRIQSEASTLPPWMSLIGPRGAAQGTPHDQFCFNWTRPRTVHGAFERRRAGLVG